MAKQRRAPCESVVVFGKEKIRTIRRHFGNERRMVAEDHTKHPVRRNVCADFFERREVALITTGRCVVLPCRMHHLVGVVQRRRVHGLKSCC
ncbi:MAG: hypothetical protein EBW27_03110 [Acidimicrobiia bacterium]|nr:hypothetical protein [Acidimicrobiia bacterium]